MKHPILAVPLALSICSTLVAADLPELAANETKVLKWKDNKAAPIYLEFDDSCPTHLKNVIPELIKRQMPGTFYINPGNGQHTGNAAKWEEAAKSPYVVLANHTYKHKGVNTPEELSTELDQCQDYLQKATPHLPWPRLISFGQPGGVPWKVDKEVFKAQLAERNLVNRPPFSGPPLSYKGTEATLKVVDTAIAKGEVGHVDFHGVGGDWHIADLDLFTALLDHLEKNKDAVWVTDPVSGHQYATERKTATVTPGAATADSLKLTLTSEADPKFYNLPLTLATKVPADWKAVLVNQGQDQQIVQSKDGVAIYDAVPNGGEITLARSVGG
jgi:peptidoglycan/xylan/chitin deacetylase (PgdA/CDA1 family)